MDDLTILYITASEMPQKWMDFQLSHLVKSIGDTPIISVSRKPMDLGINLIDNEEKSYWNIYKQMLRASKEATTLFVAMAEDDTLYTLQHFRDFRPPVDAVSYNRSRWSLFSWDPIYCIRQRISNCSLIAPRDLLIEALTERDKKWPNGAPDNITGEIGRPDVERKLKVTPRKSVEWYSRGPIVQLNHPIGTDKGDYGKDKGRHMVKKHGQIQAYDIPYWGKALEVIKYYDEN